MIDLTVVVVGAGDQVLCRCRVARAIVWPGLAFAVHSCLHGPAGWLLDIPEALIINGRWLPVAMMHVMW